jgi:hypothetical protein
LARIAQFFLLALIFGAALPATADLSQSTLTFSPKAPVEGDLIRYELRVRNTSATDIEYIEVRFDAPEAAHLISTSGMDDPLLESDDRRATGHVQVAAGAEALVHVEVLTPRDAGGQSLTMRVRLGATQPLLEEWLNASVTLDDVFPEGGATLGGIRILPAALAVLAWMGGSALLFLILVVLSRRTGAMRPGEAAGATLTLMFALGLWAYHADMARRDHAILNVWTETEATVLSRRLDASSASSTSSRSTTSGRNQSRYAPELALRYQAAGGAVLSTGYGSGSALRRGGLAEREKELEMWTPGATITAWHNPRDPRDVVVKRGYGGAYLFALLGLPAFLLGSWLILRLTRPRPREEEEETEDAGGILPSETTR